MSGKAFNYTPHKGFTNYITWCTWYNTCEVICNWDKEEVEEWLERIESKGVRRVYNDYLADYLENIASDHPLKNDIWDYGYMNIDRDEIANQFYNDLKHQLKALKNEESDTENEEEEEEDSGSE